MLRIGLIGQGAIAQYVAHALPSIDAQLSLVIARKGRQEAARESFGGSVQVDTGIGHHRPDIIVDCAGHAALRDHGATVLGAGVPLATVSIGALADAALERDLAQAAHDGGTVLHLCSGAIGGLDALAAARFGRLENVTYIGRKPPRGWAGSPAEDVLDLSDPGAEATTHFDGSAREAALRYPKNANVAAAVALAGLGFDTTRVQLIADPRIDANRHEITATGDFGEMQFAISGRSLPDNPRTSALAAMSVLGKLAQQSAPIRF